MVSGDTYNISVGQGDLLVTPLWLNSYISAIANGGTIYKPMVAQKIVDGNNNDLEVFKEDAYKTALWGRYYQRNEKRYGGNSSFGTADTEGFAYWIGARPGTAEVVKGKSINSLFTAFAPFDHPELSITILIEGSVSNQGLAIQVAHNVLKWYFGNAPVQFYPQ